MAIEENKRIERIVELLKKHEALINETDKGSIEINFSGSKENVAIKFHVQ